MKSPKNRNIPHWIRSATNVIVLSEIKTTLKKKSNRSERENWNKYIRHNKHTTKMNHRRNLQINCFTFGIIWLIGYANGKFCSTFSFSSSNSDFSISLLCARLFFMAIVFSHWSLHTVDHIENTRTSFQFSDLFFFRTSVLHMTRLTRKKSTYTPKMLFEVKRKIQRNKTNKIHLGIVAFAERFTAIKKNVLFIVTYPNVCVCSILSIVLFSVVVHVHYIYIYWLLTFFSATWNVLTGCVCYRRY